MARLGLDQLTQILKKAVKGNELDACVNHHERLRLHVEEVNSECDAPRAINDFLQRTQNIMTAKKYARFKELLRFPLESNKLSKKIFADLRRVFDGKNRVISYQFIAGEAETDFSNYRRDLLRDEEFFEEDVFEHIRTNISDFIVIDMERERYNGRLNPMPYIVRVDDIIDVKVNRDNKCEYIAYHPRDNDKIRIVLDDAYYRVYKYVEGSEERWVLDLQNEHRLNECPAKPIWSDYMHPTRNYVEKTGPISASVSDMDEVNFWDVGNRYYQLYGAFPIYWEYKMPCKYQDAQGNPCEDGYVTSETVPDEFDLASGEKLTREPVRVQTKCPVCEKNDNIFAGSIVRVTAPTSKEDADMRQPMGFVPVDSKALDFNQETQEKRKQQVIDYCVGINTEPMREQAINEKQVSSFFEDRKSILFRVKRNFEIIHQWTLEIVAKLRYGNQFKKVYVNYGDEFYLRSESEIIANYKEMKSSGQPSYLLEGNRRLLAETRWRNDRQTLERIAILEELEPYNNMSVQEIVLLRQQSPETINPVKLVLKADFSNFIAKFEREQSNILIFGSQLSYNEKISLITKKLEEYVNEAIKTNREFAEQDHQRQVERLRAEAVANGAANAAKPAGQRGAAKPGADSR